MVRCGQAIIHTAADLLLGHLEGYKETSRPDTVPDMLDARAQVVGCNQLDDISKGK